MLWLIGFFLLGAIGTIALITALIGTDPEEKATAGGVTVLFAFLQIVWACIFMIHIVDVKEVAVIKTFGRISGQSDCKKEILPNAPIVSVPSPTSSTPVPGTTPIAVPTIVPTPVLPISNLTNPNVLVKCGGLVLTWPFQRVSTWNVREDFVYADTTCRNNAERCLDAGSNEQQDVYIVPKLSIKISPDNVQRLAADPGNNYVERVVRPLMKTTIKDVTKDYVATDIHLKRSEIEARVAARLQNELGRYSIEVIRMTFENLDFSPEYNKAIELKVQQTQKALEEQGKIQVIIEQAKQAEEEARGKAAAARQIAQGQADANYIVNASLTPLLLQWQAVQKFNDDLNIALVPSGEGLLLDPSTFLRQTAPAGR